MTLILLLTLVVAPPYESDWKDGSVILSSPATKERPRGALFAFAIVAAPFAGAPPPASCSLSSSSSCCLAPPRPRPRPRPIFLRTRIGSVVDDEVGSAQGRKMGGEVVRDCDPSPGWNGSAASLPTPSSFSPQSPASNLPFPVLVHWRGEGLGPGRSYSEPFRRDEFRGAFYASLLASRGGEENEEEAEDVSLEFTDALWRGDPRMAEGEERRRDLELYNGSMQYVSVVVARGGVGAGNAGRRDAADDDHNEVSPPASVPPSYLPLLVDAAGRCSLVHALYQVVAEADDWEGLSNAALSNGGFNDLAERGVNADATWAVRLKHYEAGGGDGDGSAGGNQKDGGAEESVSGTDGPLQPPTQPRYGERTTRSLAREKSAILALRPLLEGFAGRVRLDGSDVKVVIVDGVWSWRSREIGSSECVEGGDNSGGPVIASASLLTRRLVKGPRASAIAPATRTPLGAVPAYLLVNVARIRPGLAVLDPYAGSCSTLLAAATITRDRLTTVGIELAHDGVVNRDDVRKDFATRGLSPPAALIEGDCTDPKAHDAARAAIGDRPFDVILADPPYGVRESRSDGPGGGGPLGEFLSALARDRSRGKPLLVRGGRMVAFVPVSEGENLMEDCMPGWEEMLRVGMRVESAREQKLSGGLSRWLVSFVCIGASRVEKDEVGN